MGNTLLDPQAQKDTMKKFESWVEDHQELSRKKLIFENKLFKTFSFSMQTENS